MVLQAGSFAIAVNRRVVCQTTEALAADLLLKTVDLLAEIVKDDICQTTLPEQVVFLFNREMVRYFLVEQARQMVVSPLACRVALNPELYRHSCDSGLLRETAWLERCGGSRDLVLNDVSTEALGRFSTPAALADIARDVRLSEVQRIFHFADKMWLLICIPSPPCLF